MSNRKPASYYISLSAHMGTGMRDASFRFITNAVKSSITVDLVIYLLTVLYEGPQGILRPTSHSDSNHSR